jgi:SAM-dependent methyltransferase
MHDTALKTGKAFFDAYAKSGAVVVEFGSRNVNGSLQDVCSKSVTYIGLDVEPASGVDVVVDLNSPVPLRSNIADIVASSSAFEHDAFFWETFLERARVTKPGGVIYVNAPSNGKYHRYPEDNWRFYPDAVKALARWAVKKRPTSDHDRIFHLGARDRYLERFCRNF